MLPCIFQVLNNQYQMKHKAIECSQKRKKEGKEGCKWNFICFCPYEAHKYQLWPHCLGGVTTHNIDPYHQKKGHVDWHHVLWFENITGRPKADDSMTSIQILLLFFHNSGRKSNLFEVIDPILQSLVSSKIYVVVQQYIQAINIFTFEAIRKHVQWQILSKHQI